MPMFAIDRNGTKTYIGNLVQYNNKYFYVENMEFISWNREQYLTLKSINNKNKILQYISPRDVVLKKKII